MSSARFFHIFALFVLWNVLLPPGAPYAADVGTQDRARLQGMSQDEYTAIRELIQGYSEGLGAAEQRLMRDASIDGRSQMENRSNGGGYGQGYGSRKVQARAAVMEEATAGTAIEMVRDGNCPAPCRERRNR